MDLSRPELELDVNVPVARGNDHYEGHLPRWLPQLDPLDALALVFKLLSNKLPGAVRSEHVAGLGVIDGLWPPIARSLPAELRRPSLLPPCEDCRLSAGGLWYI